MLHFKAHLGLLLIALPIAVLLIPAKTPIGGAPGIAVLLHLWTGVAPGVLLFLINLACFLFATVTVGWSFGFRAMYAAIVLSVVVELTHRLLPVYSIDQAVLQWVAQFFASLLMGLGLFWAIQTNYAPAGTAALAASFEKLWHFRVVRVLWGIDFGISIVTGFSLGLETGIRTFFGACVMYSIMLMASRRTPLRG